MMKKVRKTVTRILVMMLFMYVFAGCQEENGEHPKNPTNPAATITLGESKQAEPSSGVPTMSLAEPTKGQEQGNPTQVPTEMPEKGKEEGNQQQGTPTQVPTGTPAKGEEEEGQGEGPVLSGQPTQAPFVTPDPKEKDTVRDLNGFQLVIGKWTEVTELSPEYQKKLNEIQKKYNFSVVEKQVSDMYNIGTQMVLDMKDGSPEAHVYEMSPDTATKPYASTHCYDLTTLKEIDLSDPKWNTNVTELMTFGEKVYGINIGPATPTIGVLFNRRLLEEAGIDPDLPYELQRSGKWTWTRFEELCKQITRDVNNDDIIDVHAFSSYSVTILTALMASNQTQLIIKEDGSLQNNCQSVECKNAVSFATRLYTKGYVRPQEMGANWDCFIRHFQDEKTAMQFNYESVIESTYADMKDKLGFVMVPKVDEASDYYAISEENSYIIPACYDAKTASDIAFAFDQYMTVMHEAKMEKVLAPYYEHWSDKRAVEETIVMMMDQKRLIPKNNTLIGELYIENACWRYPFDTTSWEESVTQLESEWNTYLSLANRGQFTERQLITLPSDDENPGKEQPELPSTLVYGYADCDVEVINAIIENNGLDAKKNDVAHWDFVNWNDEYPARIKSLILRQKGLSGKLDVRGLTELNGLVCEQNQLTGVDIRGLSKLTALDCYENQLTGLDLSGLSNLERLECYSNLISELNLDGMNSLTRLVCSDNQLSVLDMSGARNLKWLFCDKNQLTELDLTPVQKLETLSCGSNQLSELNVNFLKKLNHLTCDENQLKKLDTGGMSNLEYIFCRSNQLVEVNLTGLTRLIGLHCENNELTDLNLKDLKSILSLGCYSNRLTKLNLNGLSTLDCLYCENNLLTSLDLSGLTKMRFFYCNGNKITEVDIRGLSSLIEFGVDDTVNVIR